MKSRKKLRIMSLVLSVLFSMVLCGSNVEVFAEANRSEILITEVMPFSQSTDDAYEFIELYNNGSSKIDLKNYRLPNQNIDITASKILPPKGVLVICTRSNTTLQSFNNYYGTSLTQDKYLTLPAVSELLSNTSDGSIILAKDNGIVAAEAQYSIANFELKKSITYKYAASGYEMNLLRGKQSPTPGSVASNQVSSKGTSVTGIALDKQYLSMQINQTAVLHATVYPDTAANKSAIWTSSDPDVVKIDANGNLTAKSEGIATITAFTVDGGYTANCTVTVGRIPVRRITLNRSSISLRAGQATILIPTIIPQNATNKLVSWHSSNPIVAGVNNEGIITAKVQGSAVITARTDDGNLTASCTVIVTGNMSYISVSGVSLDRTNVSMETGKVMILEAQFSPSDATNKNVSWTSSNSSIASVNRYGVVSAKREGTCLITVKTADGGYKASCVINVTDHQTDENISVTGVSLNKLFTFVKVGKSEKLKVRVFPENAQDKTVLWESSNKDIAYVTSDGTVCGVKEGFVVITVSTNDGDYFDECLVFVTGDKVHNHGKGKGNGQWKWEWTWTLDMDR